MTSKPENEEGFLSRWSQRKLEQVDTEEKQALPVEEVVSEPEELDDKELPIWQQKDADPDVKKQALNSLFKQTEFNDLDGLNEYDEDYTMFPKLGNVVTQEMKRMLKLAEEKTRSDVDLKPGESQQEDGDTSVLADKNNNNDEDNKLV